MMRRESKQDSILVDRAGSLFTCYSHNNYVHTPSLKNEKECFHYWDEQALRHIFFFFFLFISFLLTLFLDNTGQLHTTTPPARKRKVVAFWCSFYTRVGHRITKNHPGDTFSPLLWLQTIIELSTVNVKELFVQRFNEPLKNASYPTSIVFKGLRKSRVEEELSIKD